MKFYTYEFSATFVCGLPATASIQKAINKALDKFNSIKRKNVKRLKVTIGNKGELLYKLESGVEIADKDLLRCTQQFSKELSKNPVMEKYIRPGRLLQRC